MHSVVIGIVQRQVKTRIADFETHFLRQKHSREGTNIQYSSCVIWALFVHVSSNHVHSALLLYSSTCM